MNPLYKFTLNGNEVHPVWGDDLEKVFARETGEIFFRESLSGNISFIGDDYDTIMAQPFDTPFYLVISYSTDNGNNWDTYWNGAFYLTDCEVDEDDKRITVNPSPSDEYTALMDGLDKEFNLVELVPEIYSLRADKRPLIQLYVIGSRKITCILSGNYWEQECEPITDESELLNTYHFASCRNILIAEVSGVSGLTILGGNVPATPTDNFTLQSEDGDYTLTYTYSQPTSTWTLSGPNGVISQVWMNEERDGYPFAWADGDITVNIRNLSTYARALCDIGSLFDNPTYPLSSGDMSSDNHNYKRVIGLDAYASETMAEHIVFGDSFSASATQYGIYQPSSYYVPPTVTGEAIPICQDMWGRASIWFDWWISTFMLAIDAYGRKNFEIKNAYKIESVIQKLLSQIAPTISYGASPLFSEFLHYTTTNPIDGAPEQDLVLVPKSNILNSSYDQPAQKAPITLRQVFDMLKNVFRCYWWVESDGRLRIEHISYFMNGGSYSGTPSVGIDLTTATKERIAKAWAFATSKYKFDKAEMPERYEFGWMDEVTMPFDGWPMEMISNYVAKGKIERVSVSNFTSDLDYLLLNPNSASKDGFALLEAREVNLIKEDRTFAVNTAMNIMLEYSSASGERVFWKGTHNSGAASTVYALDKNGAIISTLYTFPNYFIDVQGYLELPAGTASIGIKTESGATTFILREFESTILSVPYYTFYRGLATRLLQNGYLSFAYLQRFYLYDLPCPACYIDGTYTSALGTKKLKMQELNFPMEDDPDLKKLIKTNLGNGEIEKMSINLSSRNAKTTLKYDTE